MMDTKTETPSKNSLKNKVLSNQIHCDSRFSPNISTPPSRFGKICNPFDAHLIDRLHMQTLSPSVFAHVSTPKSDGIFKWSIDQIASLKPAEIDERGTFSQHPNHQDSTIESLVQEKIDTFFNEKVIAPSPFHQAVKAVNLVADSPPARKCYDVAVQTLLTLPPVLPKHVDDVLAPYFSNPYEPDADSSLYRKLFDFEEEDEQATPVSSPALSTGLSPIMLSPEFNSPNRPIESTLELPAEFKDCTLSPIGRSPLSRSACRLDFSNHMSVDNSVDRTMHLYSSERTSPPKGEEFTNSSTNWDMENNHVSLLSHSPLSSPEFLQGSNSNTPHSKLFTSQRKRLSDSFQIELSTDIDMDDVRRSKGKIATESTETDVGYFTLDSTHVFASTPTKTQNKYA